jgi:hypothetical protein
MLNHSIKIIENYNSPISIWRGFLIIDSRLRTSYKLL